VIQYNEISVLEVETIQLVTRLLCLHHIFVDDKCGALCVVVDALTDLADCAELAKEVEKLVRGYVIAAERVSKSESC